MSGNFRPRRGRRNVATAPRKREMQRIARGNLAPSGSKAGAVRVHPQPPVTGQEYVTRGLDDNLVAVTNLLEEMCAKEFLPQLEEQSRGDVVHLQGVWYPSALNRLAALLQNLPPSTQTKRSLLGIPATTVEKASGGAEALEISVTDDVAEGHTAAADEASAAVPVASIDDAIELQSEDHAEEQEMEEAEEDQEVLETSVDSVSEEPPTEDLPPSSGDSDPESHIWSIGDEAEILLRKNTVIGFVVEIKHRHPRRKKKGSKQRSRDDASGDEAELEKMLVVEYQRGSKKIRKTVPADEATLISAVGGSEDGPSPEDAENDIFAPVPEVPEEEEKRKETADPQGSSTGKNLSCVPLTPQPYQLQADLSSTARVIAAQRYHRPLITSDGQMLFSTEDDHPMIAASSDRWTRRLSMGDWVRDDETNDDGRDFPPSKRRKLVHPSGPGFHSVIIPMSDDSEDDGEDEEAGNLHAAVSSQSSHPARESAAKTPGSTENRKQTTEKLPPQHPDTEDEAFCSTDAQDADQPGEGSIETAEPRRALNPMTPATRRLTSRKAAVMSSAKQPSAFRSAFLQKRRLTNNNPARKRLRRSTAALSGTANLIVPKSLGGPMVLSPSDDPGSASDRVPAAEEAMDGSSDPQKASESVAETPAHDTTSPDRVSETATDSMDESVSAMSETSASVAAVDDEGGAQMTTQSSEAPIPATESVISATTADEELKKASPAEEVPPKGIDSPATPNEALHQREPPADGSPNTSVNLTSNSENEDSFTTSLTASRPGSGLAAQQQKSQRKFGSTTDLVKSILSSSTSTSASMSTLNSSSIINTSTSSTGSLSTSMISDSSIRSHPRLSLFSQGKTPNPNRGSLLNLTSASGNNSSIDDNNHTSACSESSSSSAALSSASQGPAVRPSISNSSAAGLGKRPSANSTVAKHHKISNQRRQELEVKNAQRRQQVEQLRRNEARRQIRGSDEIVGAVTELDPEHSGRKTQCPPLALDLSTSSTASTNSSMTSSMLNLDSSRQPSTSLQRLAQASRLSKSSFQAQQRSEDEPNLPQQITRAPNPPSISPQERHRNGTPGFSTLSRQQIQLARSQNFGARSSSGSTQSIQRAVDLSGRTPAIGSRSASLREPPAAAVVPVQRNPASGSGVTDRSMSPPPPRAPTSFSKKRQLAMQMRQTRKAQQQQQQQSVPSATAEISSNRINRAPASGTSQTRGSSATTQLSLQAQQQQRSLKQQKLQQKKKLLQQAKQRQLQRLQLQQQRRQQQQQNENQVQSNGMTRHQHEKRRRPVIKPASEESIALSDHEDDSDWSDSEDESGRRTVRRIPAWAGKQNLMRQLRKQSTIDPDTIFPPFHSEPFDLDAMFMGFPKRQRWHKRGPSGNWTLDALDLEEEAQYKAEMGFR